MICMSYQSSVLRQLLFQIYSSATNGKRIKWSLQRKKLESERRERATCLPLLLSEENAARCKKKSNTKTYVNSGIVYGVYPLGIEGGV